MEKFIIDESNFMPDEYNDEICKNFKAIYYLLNAKPDTETRLFNKKKKVNISNIMELNSNLEAKLKNHNVEASLTTVIVELEKNEIIEFHNFVEFYNYNWNMKNQRTLKINFIKEFYIKLPNYQLPQKHTIKIRIGGGVSTKEAINLFFTRDAESYESKLYHSDMTCRIDFINNILAGEIFDLITKWYDSLIGEEQNFFISFFEKKDTLCINISELLIKILGGLLYMTILKKYFEYSNLFFNFEKILEKLPIIFIFTMILYFLYEISLEKFKDYFFYSFIENKEKNISLTSKDKNEMSLSSKKKSKKVWLFIITNLLVFLLNIIFSKIFELIKISFQ